MVEGEDAVANDAAAGYDDGEDAALGEAAEVDVLEQVGGAAAPMATPTPLERAARTCEVRSRRAEAPAIPAKLVSICCRDWMERRCARVRRCAPL